MHIIKPFTRFIPTHTIESTPFRAFFRTCQSHACNIFLPCKAHCFSPRPPYGKIFRDKKWYKSHGKWDERGPLVSFHSQNHGPSARPHMDFAEGTQMRKRGFSLGRSDFIGRSKWVFQKEVDFDFIKGPGKLHKRSFGNILNFREFFGRRWAKADNCVCMVLCLILIKGWNEWLHIWQRLPNF